MAKESREYFTWTDDEVELLLSLTLEYKAEKSLQNIDWESIKSKYSDIHERFVAHLRSVDEGETPGFNKEYRHRPEEVTKAIVSTNIKMVRLRYRKAVDSGRRSGQGRVVELYYTICQEIWGGSPATEQVRSGLESGDLLEDTFDGGDMSASGEAEKFDGDDEAESQITTSQPKPSTPQFNPSTSQSKVSMSQSKASMSQSKASTLQSKATSESHSKPSTSQSKATSQSRLSTSQSKASSSIITDELEGDIAKRRQLLDEKLSNYKQKNLRKRLPAADIATQDLQFKKSILQQLEDSDRAMQVSIDKMSSNMDKLSGAILSGFSMLRQVMSSQESGRVPHPIRNPVPQPYQPPLHSATEHLPLTVHHHVDSNTQHLSSPDPPDYPDQYHF